MSLHKFMLAAFAAAAFAVPTTNISADIVDIDFRSGADGGQVGIELDTNPGLDDLPFMVEVDALPGLVLTLEGITGFGAGVEVNATSERFGVNSENNGPNGNDNTSLIESEFGESFTISFNRDIQVNNFTLDSIGDDESFTFGTATVAGADLPGIIAEFEEGELTFDAGELITISTVGAVGLETLQLHVKAIPEPSSLLAIAGMAGLFAVRRRR